MDMNYFQQLSDEEFANVVAKNDNIRNIVVALGYSPSSGSMAKKVKERIQRQNLDTSHFNSYIRDMPKRFCRIDELSKGELDVLVKNNVCFIDVLLELGYQRSGSMAKRLRERMDELGVDYSHFTGRSAKPSSNPRYQLEEILVQNSPYTNIHSLKIRLVREGWLEYKCASCGNEGLWNGKPLTLQLEHKNGIHNDHRLENLCFLCPNCHSQTKTFAGKNIGRYR